MCRFVRRLFYGFFEIHHLNRFSFEEALEMLQKIAELKGDVELANLLRTPIGRARVRAIDHLAAGSPRIYVILSEFLRAESIDELVDPVLKMIENLTPYYQSRMQLITPQQRALVEYLCEREAAVTVGEIARGVLLTPQTASSQLRKLRDSGYVRWHREGRKSYYELQEPLMRIALSAKKQRGKPFRLFVEFLRCWFTESELSVRAQPGGASAAPLDSQYAQAALELLRTTGVDPRLEASARDYRRLTENQDYTRALAAAEEVVELRGAPSDWMAKGKTEIEIGQFEEALASYEKAVELDAEDGVAWRDRGDALWNLGRHEEALASYEKAVELDAEDGLAWRDRGFALWNLGRHEEALASYEKAVELDAEDGLAWRNRGLALGNLGRHEEALASLREGSGAGRGGRPGLAQPGPRPVESRTSRGGAGVLREGSGAGRGGRRGSAQPGPRAVESRTSRGGAGVLREGSGAGRGGRRGLARPGRRAVESRPSRGGAGVLREGSGAGRGGRPGLAQPGPRAVESRTSRGGAGVLREGSGAGRGGWRGLARPGRRPGE